MIYVCLTRNIKCLTFTMTILNYFIDIAKYSIKFASKSFMKQVIDPSTFFNLNVIYSKF